MKKVKIKDWPVGNDIKGRLEWIGSPQRMGLDREWMSELCFSFVAPDGRARGGKFLLKAPWGMLPALRVGSIYVGGAEFQPAVAQPLPIDVDDAEFTVVNADVVPSSLTGAPPKFLMNERCVQFADNGFLFFLPCVELLRALFAPNTWMARALLDPYFLDDYVAGDLNGDTAHLRMSDLAPPTFAHPPLLPLLALLVLDPSWRATYRRVWHERESVGHRTNLAAEVCSPLVAHLDMLRGASLMTSAVVDERLQSGLIHRIHSIRWPKPFPFAEVHCFHPKLAVASDSGGRTPTGAGGGSGSPEDEEDSQRNEGELGAEGRQRGREASSRIGAVTSLSFQTAPTLHHYSKPTPRTLSADPRPDRGSSKTSEELVTVELSAGRVSTSRGVPGIGFDPAVSRLDWPAAFRKMIEGLGWVSMRLPWFKSTYVVGEKVLEEEPRRFMFVSAKTLCADVFVLEIDSRADSDEQHWTLIFQVEGDAVPLEVANRLLEQQFNPKSGWRRGISKTEFRGLRRLEVVPHAKDRSPSIKGLYRWLLTWSRQEGIR